ncbi:GNAT family N-acetyltransferase [Olleya sp. Bg11-27]|uniref:GNAT family N-acetyltransferase n=1 Tax=Olleya sp. Bg11-27 TaxID=2058135 RepID=UPI000C31453F|nr:GNAT family N-acetyltransferase [Olleya sp. Bg11-27]AUC77048.1 GNAT family N-acetyltransferase [Olleya sp. Bg11-27]
MTFTPFPELQTTRLLLRQVTVKDSAMVLYLRSDKTINKYIQRPPERQTRTITDAVKHITMLTDQIESNTSITWGITLQNTTEIIGTICLWNFSKGHTIAEVGYDLSPKHHNKGLMSEALQAVINFGFNQLPCITIVAFTQFRNANSIKLLENNGFGLNKTLKDPDNSNNLIFELFE